MLELTLIWGPVLLPVQHGRRVPDPHDARTADCRDAGEVETVAARRRQGRCDGWQAAPGISRETVP